MLYFHRDVLIIHVWEHCRSAMGAGWALYEHLAQGHAVEDFVGDQCSFTEQFIKSFTIFYYPAVKCE